MGRQLAAVSGWLRGVAHRRLRGVAHRKLAGADDLYTARAAGTGEVRDIFPRPFLIWNAKHRVCCSAEQYVGLS